MSLQSPSARSNGIQKLFKYKPFHENDYEYLERIFKNLELYFPSPTALNDPFECKTRFVIGDLNSPNYRDIHESWCVYTQMNRKPGLNKVEYIKYYRSLSLDQHLKNTELIRQDMHDINDSRWRIFSLSKNHCSPLMWAHYANNHKGICLEFDCDNSIFGRAYKVSYTKTLNKIDVTEDDGDLYFNSLLNKTTPWEYEQEYRVLGESSNQISGLPTVIDSAFHYPSEFLTGIIFGARMNKKDIDIVKSWLEDSFSHVTLKKIVLLEDGRLDTQPI